ncbi:MAG: hypothetical protein AAGI52_15015 [Bacteroidota bacterium]
MHLLSRLPLLLLTAFMLWPITADAQLGRLRDRARRPAEDMTRQRAEEARRATEEQAAEEANAQSDAVASTTQQATLAPLDFSSSPMPPAIMFESVLRHLDISPTSGSLRLPFVSVAFPPTKDVNGADVNYGKQMRFHVQLKDASGTLMMDRYYSPQQVGNRVFTKFEPAYYQPINNRPLARLDAENPLVIEETGAYTFHFFLDDREFWHLPFEVLVLRDDDPYSSGGSRYFLRGPWQAYGFVSFAESTNGDSPAMYWQLYRQHESLTETDRRVSSEVTLHRGGELLGRSTQEEVIIMNEKEVERWTFRKTGTRDPFTRADLTDGCYEIRTALGGGEPEIHTFEVRGGAIVPQGRQVREGTDPLSFIEGINESWWIPSQ